MLGGSAALEFCVMKTERFLPGWGLLLGFLKCPSGHCYYWLLDWITLLVKFSGNFRFSWWIFLEKAKQLQRSPNVIKHWTLFASHFVEEAGILWFTISLGAAVQVVIDERCQVPHLSHWHWGVCISSTLKDSLQSLIILFVSSVRSSSGYHGLLEGSSSTHFFRFFKFFRF